MLNGHRTVLSCFGRYGVLCAVVNFPFCRVTSGQMKHSLDNSDLTKDHDHTKARKSLDFGREGRDDVDY